MRLDVLFLISLVSVALMYRAMVLDDMKRHPRFYVGWWSSRGEYL